MGLNLSEIVRCFAPTSTQQEMSFLLVQLVLYYNGCCLTCLPPSLWKLLTNSLGAGAGLGGGPGGKVSALHHSGAASGLHSITLVAAVVRHPNDKAFHFLPSAGIYYEPIVCK